MNESPNTIDPLGLGIYGMSEAAKLTGISHARVRAWFSGWNSPIGRVLSSDYSSGERDIDIISFLDLIEMLVVSKLRESNVSLHTIRCAYKQLIDFYKLSHPFSRKELFVDKTSQQIFHRIANDEDDDDLIEIMNRQHAIPDILNPYLNRVDYDSITGLAVKWHIYEGILIDPMRKYGKPVLQTCNLPTHIIAQAYLANKKDIEKVADWYNITIDDVKDAIAFESETFGLAA